MKSRLIVFCLALLGFVCRANAENSITIGDVTATAGSRVMIPISFTNDVTLSGFEFHVSLPEGVDFVRNVPADRCYNNYGDILVTISSNYSEGVYKYSTIPTGADPIKGTEGVVFYIEVVIADAAAIGSSSITLTKALFFREDGSQINVADATATLTVERAVEIPDFSFYSDKLVIAEGQTSATLGIALKNSEAVKSFAFNVVLPAGVTPAYYRGDVDIDGTSRFVGDRNTYPNAVEGQLFYVTGSPVSDVTPGDGALLKLNLEVGSNVVPGTYDIAYTNEIVTKADNSVAVTLTHATPYLNGNQTTNSSVSYVRSFSHDGWQALYVPFSMTQAEWSKIGQVAQLTGVSGTADAPVLEWTTVTGSIAPNTPYIIKPKAAGPVIFSAQNTTLAAVPALEGTVSRSGAGGTYTLHGIYQEKTDMATTGAYGLSKGNFRPTNSDSKTLKPYLIYLAIDSAQGNAPAAVSSVVDEEAASVSGIVMGRENGKIYDLQGREVRTPQRGLYIENGKKILINK